MRILSSSFRTCFSKCSGGMPQFSFPFEAMEILIQCGVKRILTSGGKKNAEDGISLLKQLREKANGRIIIVPGGGVTILNAERILRETGCTEIHSSAKGERIYDEITPDPEMIKELKRRIS